MRQSLYLSVDNKNDCQIFQSYAQKSRFLYSKNIKKYVALKHTSSKCYLRD
jgi:hypothetical protein